MSVRDLLFFLFSKPRIIYHYYYPINASIEVCQAQVQLSHSTIGKKHSHYHCAEYDHDYHYRPPYPPPPNSGHFHFSAYLTDPDTLTSLLIALCLLSLISPFFFTLWLPHLYTVSNPLKCNVLNFSCHLIKARIYLCVYLWECGSVNWDVLCDSGCWTQHKNWSEGLVRVTFDWFLIDSACHGDWSPILSHGYWSADVITVWRRGEREVNTFPSPFYCIIISAYCKRDACRDWKISYI